MVSGAFVIVIYSATALAEPVALAADLPQKRELGAADAPAVVESVADRWLWGLLALMVIAAFLLSAIAFWIPANPGTDQNGYLVGGKLFAKTFSTGFKPANPYEFVGRMWVEVPGGKFFPKYPLGLSVIYAAALQAGGPAHGIQLALLINPIAMALALLATFLFCRLIIGSYWALLATLMLATSPVCIGLTDNPNSHATAIFCVAWGMYLLLRWWKQGHWWRAALAGLLIGTTVTIRYTEGLVVLPVLLVVVLKKPRINRPQLIEIASLGAAWLAPVLTLVIHNLVSMHHLTGYDPTNESTGFTFEKFQDNWETMLRELYNTGLFFTLPFTLIGAALLFKFNWKTASVLAVWVVPNLLLYSSYYWAPDGSTISYLRFTLTIFPALVLLTMVALRWIVEQGDRSGAPLVTRLAVGLVLAFGFSVNLHTALGFMETDTASNRATLDGTRAVLASAPAGSVIFGAQRMLNFLQLAGNYDLYELQQFDRKTVAQYAVVDPDAPTGLQPQRALEIYDREKNWTETDLVHQQNQLMIDALTAGKKVFIVSPRSQLSFVERFTNRRLFITKSVNSWDEQPSEIPGKKQRWLGFNKVQKVRDPTQSERTATWEVIEVTLAPPPPPPASKHPSRPSTKPAPAVKATAATKPSTTPKLVIHR